MDAKKESRLLKSEQIAEGTMAFHLQKPAGFDFTAGQSLDLAILEPPETDAEGNTSAFSIASPPYAADLVIATRMRDTAFKRFLKSAAAGARLQVDGPFGDFTLNNNSKKPAVFLAGGIGITPFASIVRQAAQDRVDRHLYLFYSNRRPEDAVFLEPLKAAQSKMAGKFVFVPTMTQMEQSAAKWEGEKGMIDRNLLEKYLPQLQGPIYYIAGPPGLVAAMRQILTSAGVDADDIRTEEFAGY